MKFVLPVGWVVVWRANLGRGRDFIPVAAFPKESMAVEWKSAPAYRSGDVILPADQKPQLKEQP